MNENILEKIEKLHNAEKHKEIIKLIEKQKEMNNER